MKDLIDFNSFRMKALEEKIKQLEIYVHTLETYCFELADKDCPIEYKKIIINEIYNLRKNGNS